MSLLPEPKFKVGDEVFYCNFAWKASSPDDSNIHSGIVEAVEINANAFIDINGESISFEARYWLDNGKIKDEYSLYKNRGDI